MKVTRKTQNCQTSASGDTYFLMSIHSLPHAPRILRATEQRLDRIYDAARLGLKGDALALNAGMLPQEFRQLCEFDPRAALAGRKAGSAEASAALTLETASRGRREAPKPSSVQPRRVGSSNRREHRQRIKHQRGAWSRRAQGSLRVVLEKKSEPRYWSRYMPQIALRRPRKSRKRWRRGRSIRT